MTFQTKPQIAIDLIDRALSNGVRVRAWTADEAYGRCSKFLNALDQRGEAYVVEVPPNFRVWMKKPLVQRHATDKQVDPRTKYPRLQSCQRGPSEVSDLAKYSPAFRQQTPQRYRIKDTQRGAEVWEIQWATCWRQTHDEQLVSNRCTLIVARNVLTGEVKIFLSNRVPGRDGWTLREILRVAFGRWAIEDCFREVKEELGFDHFECRLWHCIHRHLYVAILSQLFCARVRQAATGNEDVLSGELLTTEQVRRATSVVISALGLPPKQRNALYAAESQRQNYYTRRNATAARSHHKKRRQQLAELGINIDKIKTLPPLDPLLPKANMALSN